MYKENFSLLCKGLLGDGKRAGHNGEGKETLFSGIPSLFGEEKENLTKPVLRSSYAQEGPLGDVKVSNLSAHKSSESTER